MELSKEDSVIVIGMHRIVSDMDRQTRQICKAHDLTLGQFSVLEALYNKGELTIGEVKELVLSTDGTIPVVIGNLEKRGYLDRRQDAKDKRKYIVSLTDSGRKIIAEVCPENYEMLRDRIAVYTEEEKTALVEMIRKYRNYNNK